MSKRRKPTFVELAGLLKNKLRPPVGIVLGSPDEVLDLVAMLPGGDVTCFQMDLYQAEKLRLALKELSLPGNVETAADLWDLKSPVQTLLYPVPRGGERALKLDIVEQAHHTLLPKGTFVVLSPYEKDDLFPAALKKVFGGVHNPMREGSAILWSQRDGDKSRRRHEMSFQVRIDDATSYRFLSRPGAFSYGKFDDGARALTEVMRIKPGDRILDLGCGIGTNGIIASYRSGAGGAVTFVDSNLRAIAVTEINARNLNVPGFETVASATLKDLPATAYDVVLANPPYYAQLTIARLFIERAHACLKPGGKLFLVTKQVEQVAQVITEVFGEADVHERRGYVVYEAIRE